MTGHLCDKYTDCLHDFMLCDFKNNQVRKNFDEILSIPRINAAQKQEQAKTQEAPQEQNSETK
eukprot:SAG22_NODE_1401_length_4497_cov_101.460891_6_plen_63_part_00